jgi:outer membrane lipoprotein carrier protein
MRIRNIFKVFVVFFAVLLPAFAQANKTTDAIQKRYDTLSSFQADFQQELTNAASGSVEKRTGKLWFKKSLVRWETLKPEKELLIVGQQHVWDYFEVDHIAMKYRTNQAFSSSKTMIRFLSGKANLKEDFKIEEQGTENGLVKLRLIPKDPEPTMVLAYIWVDTKTNLLARVLTVDFYGNGNQVSLSNLALDKKVDSRLFEFTPPSGVQVKDNSKQK